MYNEMPISSGVGGLSPSGAGAHHNGASANNGTSLSLNPMLAQQLYATHFTGATAPTLHCTGTAQTVELPTVASSAPSALSLVAGAAVASGGGVTSAAPFSTALNATAAPTVETPSTMREGGDGGLSSGTGRSSAITFTTLLMADAPSMQGLASSAIRGPLDHFSHNPFVTVFSANSLGTGECGGGCGGGTARASGSGTPNLTSSSGGVVGTGASVFSSAVSTPNADDSAQNFHASLIDMGDADDHSHNDDAGSEDTDEEEDGAGPHKSSTMGSRQGSTTAVVGKFALAGPNAGVAGSKAAAAAAAAAASAAVATMSTPHSGATPRLSVTPRSLFASAQNPSVAGAGSTSASAGGLAGVDVTPPIYPLLPPPSATGVSSTSVASALETAAARLASSPPLSGSSTAALDLPSGGTGRTFSTSPFGTSATVSSTPPIRTHLHSPAQGAVKTSEGIDVVYGVTSMAIAPPPVIEGPRPAGSVATTPRNSPRPLPLTLTQKQHQLQAMARKQALAAQQLQQHVHAAPEPPQLQKTCRTSQFSPPDSGSSTSSNRSDGGLPGDSAGRPLVGERTSPPHASLPPPELLFTPPVSGTRPLPNSASGAIPPPALPPPTEASQQTTTGTKTTFASYTSLTPLSDGRVEGLDDARLVHLFDSLATSEHGAPLSTAAPADVGTSRNTATKATTDDRDRTDATHAVASATVSGPFDTPRAAGTTLESPPVPHAADRFLAAHPPRTSQPSATPDGCAVASASVGVANSGSSAPLGATSSVLSTHSSRSNSTPRSPTTPIRQSARSPTSVPHGPVVEVYSPDFRYLLSIPAHQVVHQPPPALGVSRLVLCRSYDAATGRGCTKGECCKFVHADTSNAGRCTIHVNYAYRSLDVCSYARLPSGGVLDVLAPNERPPCEPIPSEHILVTQGSKSWYNAQHPASQITSPDRASADKDIPTRCDARGSAWPPSASGPLSHCAHYYFNRICNRGDRCHFIHAVHVDPTVTKDFKRAPAPTTVAPITKRTQTTHRNQRHHQLPQQQQQQQLHHAPPPPPSGAPGSPAGGNMRMTTSSPLRSLHGTSSGMGSDAYAPLPPPPPPFSHQSLVQQPPQPGLFPQGPPLPMMFGMPVSGSGHALPSFAYATALNTINGGASATNSGGVRTPVKHSPVSGQVGPMPHPPPPALTLTDGAAIVYFDAVTGTAICSGPPSQQNYVPQTHLSTPTNTTTASPTMPALTTTTHNTTNNGLHTNSATTTNLTGLFGVSGPPPPTAATSPHAGFLTVSGGPVGGNGAGLPVPAVPPCGSPFSATALELSPLQTHGNIPSLNSSSLASPLDWSFYGDLDTAPAAWPTTPTNQPR